MSVSRYRLTMTGWIGAALFVLPTPLSVWYLKGALSLTDAERVYNQALGQVRGEPVFPEVSTGILVLLATASLVGLVMLLVGREIETLS